MSVTITGPISQVAIESIGRRRVITFGQLDQMQCVFFGPAGSFDSFPINASHPEYPLMFCTGSQGEAVGGNLIQINVSYEGKMLTGGQSSYVTYPVTSETPVQGSRDFTLLWAQTHATYIAGVAGGPGTQPGYIYTNDVGTRSLAVRYVGTQCSVRYQAYPRPTKLHYSQLGLGRVTWAILSQTYGPVSPIAYGVDQNYLGQLERQYITVPPPLIAANLGFEIEQRGKWYNCVETYGPTF